MLLECYGRSALAIVTKILIDSRTTHSRLNMRASKIEWIVALSARFKRYTRQPYIVKRETVTSKLCTHRILYGFCGRVLTAQTDFLLTQQTRERVTLTGLLGAIEFCHLVNQ